MRPSTRPIKPRLREPLIANLQAVLAGLGKQLRLIVRLLLINYSLSLAGVMWFVRPLYVCEIAGGS